MTRLPTQPGTAKLSALQRRLLFAAEHPDRHDWVSLVENVPEWPASSAPDDMRQVSPRSALNYPPTQGNAALRAAIAESVHCGVSAADNVLVTGGGMHAIGLLARDLYAQGRRRVRCAVPVFAGVAATLGSAGLQVQPMPVGDLVATPELLRRHCGDGDVVYLNLPHNPTGAVLTAPLLAHLVDLLHRRDLVVIYDAVYDAFDFSPDPIPTPVWLALETPRFAMVHSMSKNYGRPGDRIGWIVGHADLVDRLLPRLEWECVAVSAAAQAMAAAALRLGNDRLVEVVRAGRTVLQRDARAVPPGGTQCWWDLRLADVEAFADFALWEYGVILATGANYFPFAEGHIRFPTGIAEPRIRVGLERIAAATRAWAVHDGVAATGSVRAAGPVPVSSLAVERR